MQLGPQATAGTSDRVVKWFDAEFHVIRGDPSWGVEGSLRAGGRGRSWSRFRRPIKIAQGVRPVLGVFEYFRPRAIFGPEVEAPEHGVPVPEALGKVPHGAPVGNFHAVPFTTRRRFVRQQKATAHRQPTATRPERGLATRPSAALDPFETSETHQGLIKAQTGPCEHERDHTAGRLPSSASQAISLDGLYRWGIAEATG